MQDVIQRSTKSTKHGLLADMCMCPAVVSEQGKPCDRLCNTCSRYLFLYARKNAEVNDQYLICPAAILLGRSLSVTKTGPMDTGMVRYACSDSETSRLNLAATGYPRTSYILCSIHLEKVLVSPTQQRPEAMCGTHVQFSPSPDTACWSSERQMFSCSEFGLQSSPSCSCVLYVVYDARACAFVTTSSASC